MGGGASLPLVHSGANVFVIAGQSNALSTGASGTPTNFGSLDSNIKIWTGAAWATYDPATNGINGTSAGWGPEAEFAYYWRQANPGKTLYIVKRAESGSPLYSFASPDWNVGSAGDLYSQLTTSVNNAVANLVSASADPKVMGLIWVQGESDAGDTEANALAYTANLTAFVAAARANWSRASTMKFVASRINMATQPWRDTVRPQQLAIPTFISRSAVVSTDAFAMVDTVHYNSAGIELLGLYAYRAYMGTYNSAPTDIAVTWGGSYSSGQVPSNTSVGATLATLSSTNTVAGGTVTYSLASNPDGKVSISGTSLLLAASITQGVTYNFTIRVTNTMGTYFDEAFSITGAAPVVVYNTLNPSDKAAVIALSGGNLIATHSGTTGFANVRAVTPVTSGLCYAELTITSGTANIMFGLAESGMSLTAQPGFTTTTSHCYWYADAVYFNSATVTNMVGSGTLVQIALNKNTNRIWYRRGGNWNNNVSADPSTGVGGFDISAMGATLYPFVGIFTDTNSATVNFGATAYTGTPPSGFGNFPGI